jgi:hypothetical protein
MPSLGSYLQPVIGNIGNMKDYAHASRLYADNVFALAPKAGWMYYVVFDIDPSTITDQTWANQQRVSEVGMLVKSADLPKFAVQTEMVNQYNRKTVIQKAIQYNPVSITMHDDQSNVVHNMWLNYYRYYYADSTWGGKGPTGTAGDNTPGAYQNNKYLPSNDLFNPTNYGLNSQLVVAPFFRSITIYQLNRKLFTSFKLVNPIIQTWDHDRVDQSQGNKMTESRMALNYEAVFYGAGQVKKDTPTGFAVFHYDNSPSPLSIAGGGNNSLLGPGGVIPGALQLFGDVSNLTNPDSQPSIGNVIGVALEGVNLVRNVKSITKDSLRAEGYAILNSTLQKVGQGGLNGLGVNLNLNKSNNYATKGQYLGTPVSVVDGTGAGQSGPAETITQAGKALNGVAPITANSLATAGAALAGLTGLKNSISKVFGTNNTINSDPSGVDVATANYFDAVEPLTDTEPYVASNIDETSSPEDINGALKDLQTAQSSDLDFARGQSPSKIKMYAKLAFASSDQEKSAIKSEADAKLTAAQNLVTSVETKYKAEYDRLNGLLKSAKEATGASDNVQTSAEAFPVTNAPESSAAPAPTSSSGNKFVWSTEDGTL